MNEDQLLSSRILIVDDLPANLRLLEDLLSREGFSNLVSTTEPQQALDLHAAFDPDLLLLDLMMPGMSGFAVLEQLERARPAYEFRPVLVMTADATGQARHRALGLGAKDFLVKPFDPVEAMLRVWNLLETRWLHQQLRRLVPEGALLPARSRLHGSS